MLTILSTINNILSNDATLASLLADYNGSPAIAFQVAPPDMAMPYIVTSVETDLMEANRVVERMVYTVDVYTDNGDIVTADAIAQQVKLLLNDERLMPDVGIGIWYESNIVVPEDDPGIQHINLRFTIRYF